MKFSDTCGTANPRSKLTDDDIRAIRSMDDSGLFSRKEIAAKMGVSRQCIGKIVGYKAWRHVQ
jgi:predicted DNA-binding protein (UPF0251 family)